MNTYVGLLLGAWTSSLHGGCVPSILKGSGNTVTFRTLPPKSHKVVLVAFSSWRQVLAQEKETCTEGGRQGSGRVCNPGNTGWSFFKNMIPCLPHRELPSRLDPYTVLLSSLEIKGKVVENFDKSFIKKNYASNALMGSIIPFQRGTNRKQIYFLISQMIFKIKKKKRL